jgi:hypothetical protein
MLLALLTSHAQALLTTVFVVQFCLVSGLV